MLQRSMTATAPKRKAALCRRQYLRLECRRLRHHRFGLETVILANLRECCVAATATPACIACLHSKGSYHDHRKQRLWRRALTARPPDGRCDYCGAQFYTVWGALLPGSMWTAPLTGGGWHRTSPLVRSH